MIYILFFLLRHIYGRACGQRMGQSGEGNVNRKSAPLPTSFTALRHPCDAHWLCFVDESRETLTNSLPLATNATSPPSLPVMSQYDEVDILDMDWSEELKAYTYQCPCGDLFQITVVRSSEDIEIPELPGIVP